MSSVIRCRANSQKQTTILCRMLLDVEQTLNNRPLFYGECCLMESKLSITDHYLMSSVVRCRANSQITDNYLMSNAVKCRANSQ